MASFIVFFKKEKNQNSYLFISNEQIVLLSYQHDHSVPVYLTLNVMKDVDPVLKTGT